MSRMPRDNGQTLIGNITGSTGSFGSVNISRNEAGASYTIATADGSAFYGSLIGGSLAPGMTAGAAQAALVVGTNAAGGAAGAAGLFVLYACRSRNSSQHGWHRDQLRQQSGELQ